MSEFFGFLRSECTFWPGDNGDREPESRPTFHNASSTHLLAFSRVSARTVKRGQRIKPGRTFFQLILPLNQPLKTNYLPG